MDLQKFHGIFPAFYACYDERGEVSADGTRRLAAHYVKKGVHGLYVGGSSGECIYLSVEERKKTLEAVMETVGGKCTVIAHVACNNTRDSMALADHAQALGVDAVAAIPPIYFRLPEDEIAAYWSDISSAAPQTPFIIYNIPQLAGVSLTMPLFEKMLKNPMVAGVKNSSMPIDDIQKFKRRGGDGCVVYNGADAQLLAGLCAGADGGIGGTYGAMPELFLAVYRAVEAGDLKRAQQVQRTANDIIRALHGKGSMYAVIKRVLEMNEGLMLGSVRKPLAGLYPEDQARCEDCAKMIREAVSCL